MAEPRTLTIRIHISSDRRGEYFTIPLQVPPGMRAMTLSYAYERRAWQDQGDFQLSHHRNTIDLGLIGPDGSQVGASGSDKQEITISEEQATPGYRPCPLIPGEWRILVGAYRVASEGVDVTYTVSFQPKLRRLLRGQLHAHTFASDGVHSLEELAAKALRHELGFLAITDHNQTIAKAELPRRPGLTLIPGVEWTHYRGHANFYGVDRPYDGPFATNTLAETQSIFHSARERGALISINHPFDRDCGFAWDMDSLPWDCLEIWNGPMREENLWALALWQSMLSQGRRIPAVGGSDYHRDSPFLFLAGPTQCVWADSAGQSDILAALGAGRGYIIYAPDGPLLELRAGTAWMGEAIPYEDGRDVRVRLEGLKKGDLIRLVTQTGAIDLAEAPGDGRFETIWSAPRPGFVRVEVQRSFIPGIPRLPALLSNPIYLDDRS